MAEVRGQVYLYGWSGASIQRANCQRGEPMRRVTVSSASRRGVEYTLCAGRLVAGRDADALN
jgi:hypothetical protein